MSGERFQNLLSRGKGQDNFQGESVRFMGLGRGYKTRVGLALSGRLSGGINWAAHTGAGSHGFGEL